MILNMAKKRMRNFIIKLLKESGPMNTHEIYDAIKEKYIHGGCRNEVAALLGRTSGVMKVGFLEETREQRVRCAIWDFED